MWLSIYPRVSSFKTISTLLAFWAAGTSYAAAPCKPASELPAISGNVVNVSNATELQNAISSLQDNTTILLGAGTYTLQSTLYIRKANVTLRGAGSSCEAVTLAGKGMDNSNYGNVPHGIWTDATNLTVSNLTIRDVYYHGVIFNPGAQSPTVSSVRILNSGQQHIKANPTQYGVGVNNGVVENSYFAYTAGTPSTDHGAGVGYTNGVDVHAGKNWRISNNKFESFHTPDTSSWWWNPAILMWNGAAGTIVENNVFINVDRAIAFGLMERNGNVDHQGGIIRNNMVYYTPNLFSANRKADSDAAIIVWNSPDSVVVNNTVITGGNLNKSIEFRFNTTNAQAINNLTDIAMGSRNSATYTQTCNSAAATASLFVDAPSGNLRLKDSASIATNKCAPSTYAPVDIDGRSRPGAGQVDIGAHEYGAMSPPNPPVNVQGSQG